MDRERFIVYREYDEEKSGTKGIEKDRRRTTKEEGRDWRLENKVKRERKGRERERDR